MIVAFAPLLQWKLFLPRSLSPTRRVEANESYALRRIILKIIFGLIACALFVWVAEFGWFYFVLQKGPVNETSDVIVVFAGAHTRIVKGFELANRGLAANLIVSPASAGRLKYLDKSYRKTDLFNYFIEDRAETTFQNAVLVADLIEKHDINSVALVTTDYHMPRSHLLLKLNLSGVSVRQYPVEVGRFRRNPLAWSSMQKKRIYNEMVELWGSVFEMVYYRLTGRLPEKGLKRNKTITLLRSILLFDLQS
jgi:uncharacterized SAM-binding protein YcdF (DUF218 family)